jgi:hypothetical protein
MTLEDLAGSVEVVVFPRAFEKTPDLWQEGIILLIEGKVDVDQRDDRARVVLDKAEEWTAPTNGEAPPPMAQPGSNGAAAPSNGAAYAGNGVAGTNGTNGHQPAPTNGAANGHAPAAVVQPGAVRTVRITVPRQDDTMCVRVLEQLHALVERFPGEDAVQLLLQDRTGGLVELEDARILVRFCTEVDSQTRALVGDENVALTSVSSAA